MCIITFIINQVIRVEERRNEVFFLVNTYSDGVRKDTILRIFIEIVFFFTLLWNCLSVVNLGI